MRLSKRRTSRGFAFIVLLAFMTVGALYLFVSQLDAAAVERKREEVTANAFASTTEALIGWSAARGSAGNPRPGELPCPDTKAPGTANYGFEDPSCAAGAIGRVPWRTLGIEEPRDGYGETLWYAVDGAFRKRPANQDPINSDTRATMQAYEPDGVTLHTPIGREAVALLISPGFPVGAQARGTATEQTTAANYLDAASPPSVVVARNNASNNGPFIRGPVQDTSGTLIVNDRIHTIAANQLMAVVEPRVAKELVNAMASYAAANGGKYPFPARFNDPNCLNVGPTAYFTSCNGDTSVCRGRIPIDALPTAAVPGWLVYNLWGQVAYYAVSTTMLASVPAGCAATATMSVDGAPVSAMFIMPGTPLGSISRNTGTQSIQLSDYVEDAMNQNGWSGGIPAANQSCTPRSINCLPAPVSTGNDQLYVLP